MQTKLNLISEIARKDKKCKLNNLAHLLNVVSLTGCFYELKKDKASGIDDMSFQDYQKNLVGRLTDLVARMKRQAYKPQPVLRVHIPKENGKTRPLGIMAIEDKIVSKGIAKILQAIYEQDFLNFSYGFRPGRSCQAAVNALDKMIMQKPVNYVIDADIKGFFDNVDHKWLMRCLEERIGDRNLLRLMSRFLKAGVMEKGKFIHSDKGTPQGSISSPVLSNIYLHYVLDLWMEKIIKRKYQGYVGIVRYADDFIICVQDKTEAELILVELKERLLKFDLELSAEKTRLIEFGRNARDNAKRRRQRVGSFNFLGFTHFCDKSRSGKFKLGRITNRKKFAVKIREMNKWLKAIRNQVKIRYWWLILCSKLRGHFQYYGVSGNFRGIQRFYYLTIKFVFKWMNRRSQKKSCNWDQFRRYLERYPLPKPKIYHNLYTLYGY
ncbi:MAG: group II intron reverse transcriptase/maturase [bacterium]|nr:group II intron reverse transcriptase/maturase [bacterium]